MSQSKSTTSAPLRFIPGKFILCLASLLIIANVTLAQTPTPTPSPAARRASARPFPPPQYIPPHDYDQRNIKLEFRFDWEKEQAIGIETITLAPTVKDLKRVDFDAAFMTVASAKLAKGGPLKFDYDGTKEKLSITLDRAYQPNEEITIVISYHTNKPPAERTALIGGGGLNFILPRADDPTRRKQVWSQGEAEANHFWFACFDHPNDFVTTEIVATVEKPFSVISNGKLISTKENSDGTRTFDWKIDVPHATYLTSIVVGEFAPVVGEYAGIPVLTYVYPNELEEGKVTASRLPEMVKFFSEQTGVKYPYAKYAQTTVRDFGGGMENISATTQTDNMIHDARAELDGTSDSLESHELAHQWFGDYVTCRNWSDIWLNESFATYFQAMWDEHHLGHDDFLYSDVKSNQEQYFTAWARGLRRPIVTRHYANPDAVFDTYAYPRGGAVLHMLRTYLGEDNWWRSINHYLTKYAHQPVETAQFRIAIEETTGQPMDWFFDEWVYKMGHPVFRVIQDYDAQNKQLILKVRQEQKPDPDSQYPQAGFFQTPVDIQIATAANTRVERVQIEPKEEQTFKFTVDSEPLLVGFDYGGTLIKELTFVKTTGQLLYQLGNDKDVLGRIWALSQLAPRMNDEKTAAADRDAIRKALAVATKDQFWGARFEAVAALNGSREEKDVLIAATKDANPRVRARAVRSLATTKDSSLADVYLQLLNDQSYGVVRSASTALGQTKSPLAYDALVKLIGQPSWRDSILASALDGLAALGDKRALDFGLKYFTPGNQTGVRINSVGLLAAVGKDDPRTYPLISAALTENVERGTAGPLAGAEAEALSVIGDERTVTLFQQLAKTPGISQQMAAILARFDARLREKLGQTKSGP
ncbi:MAG TPA: M1 family aminopeptidase [Pyrinomonadaceae bacterium]|nr:M1 family aminopeptidase [Pyrinomonadaceae bacterium]